MPKVIDPETGEEVEVAETPTPDVVKIPVEPPKEEPKVEKTFTAADIEKARQQEKDKLYPRLQTMEEELATVRKDRELREASEAAALKEAEKVRKAAEKEQMSAAEKIEALSAEMEARVQQAEERAQLVETTFNKEREYQALVEYRSKRLTEEVDNVLPDLAELVTGSTPEEIDNALALVINKSSAIMEQFVAATQQQRQTQRGASVTAPATGPMDNEATYQTLTAADIAAMDPQMYAQHRDKLMAAASQRARSGGLYS